MRRGWKKRLRRAAKRSPLLRRASGVGQAAALWLLWRLCGALSPEAAARAGAAVGARIGPLLPRSNYVRRNYAVIFPGLDARRRAALVRAHWANFGAVLAEFPHIERICGAADGARHVELAGSAALPDDPVRGIYVSAHLANWEIPSVWFARRGLPLTLLFSPQSSPLLDRLMAGARRTDNCRYVAKRGAARGLARALAEGRSLGLLVDQRIDDDTDVPFFGHPAPTTTMPARLALASGAPLVPVRIERCGPARFRITVLPPIAPRDRTAPRTEQAFDMTAQLHALFESWIRDRPDEWLCGKRRWRDDVYRAAGAG